MSDIIIVFQYFKLKWKFVTRKYNYTAFVISKNMWQPTITVVSKMMEIVKKETAKVTN